MDLKDYIKEVDKVEKDLEPLPTINRKKKEKPATTTKQVQEPTAEMDDDECLQFYVDLSNMTYMALNKDLRHIEIDEVEPVKTAVSNVVRTMMKYIGDYRFFLDVAVVGGFSMALYKQRKAEITKDNPDNSTKNNSDKIIDIKNKI